MKLFCLICFSMFMSWPVYSSQGPMSCLFEAVKRGDKEEVVRLIEQGADVNSVDSRPRQGTLFPMYRELTGLMMRMFCSDSDSICGVTPLHYAALYCHIDIALLLVHEGADVTVIDYNAFTVVDYANVSHCADVARAVRGFRAILSVDWENANFSP